MGPGRVDLFSSWYVCAPEIINQNKQRGNTVQVPWTLNCFLKINQGHRRQSRQCLGHWPLFHSGSLGWG
jgi:hypothetical protein